MLLYSLFLPLPPVRSTQVVLGYVVNKLVHPSSLWFSSVSFFLFCLLLSVAHNKNIKENVKNYNTASDRRYQNTVEIKYTKRYYSRLCPFACN